MKRASRTGPLRVMNDGTTFLAPSSVRSEEHTSELQSLRHLVCRLLLEKKNARSSRPSPLKSPDTRASGEAPTAPDDGGRETLQKPGTVRLSRQSSVGLSGRIRRKAGQR